MFNVGQRIGGYEILRELRAGGMATLYLARRAGAAGFTRLVAIKIVHPHLTRDPSFVRMFLDEALLCSRIHHPNVVQVEELGDVGGAYFMAMEYVHGCSLWEVLRVLAKQSRAMAPEIAVWIAMQVADGLHAAHQLKGDAGEPLHVVHRDVSPQNVLLSYDGHVKLIDFGIAKSRARTQETSGASLKGKIAYMPPEQAYGEPIDHRADVYALALVLWEMLTMRRAFNAANDLALLEKVRRADIAPPSTIADGVPTSLDEALRHALARDRNARTASAYEFRSELLDAMPVVGSLDATRVADLLASAMRDRIAADRAMLPTGSPLSAPLPARDGSAPRIPANTVTANGASALLEGDAGSDAANPHVGGSAPMMSLPSVETRAFAESIRPRRPRWLFAAGVTALVAGSVALALRGRSHEPAPVPHAAAQAPAVPAAPAPAPTAAPAHEATVAASPTPAAPTPADPNAVDASAAAPTMTFEADEGAAPAPRHASNGARAHRADAGADHARHPARAQFVDDPGF